MRPAAPICVLAADVAPCTTTPELKAAGEALVVGAGKDDDSDRRRHRPTVGPDGEPVALLGDSDGGRLGVAVNCLRAILQIRFEGADTLDKEHTIAWWRGRGWERW